MRSRRMEKELYRVPVKNLNKFPVTDRAVKNMKETMYKQNLYGLPKYGEPLRSDMNYDWDAMADEEIADFLNYRQCARERKNEVVQLLRAGLHSENPKEFIGIALELLTIGGTGK